MGDSDLSVDRIEVKLCHGVSVKTAATTVGVDLNKCESPSGPSFAEVKR